tara:strand:- start:2257 stop:3063 length:807 start_codon:yes stop_codon:yes gene_type:complete
MVKGPSIEFNIRKMVERKDHTFKKFNEEFEKLKQIREKSENLDPLQLQAMKNYTIVRLVSILDVQMQLTITELIDSYKISPQTVLEEPSMKVRFNDFESINDKKFSLGEIVTTNLNYVTDPKNVDRYFSNINDLDFFDWVEQLFPGTGFKEKITELLYHRNDIIHQLKNNEDSIEQLKNKTNIVRAFGNIILYLSAANHENDEQRKNQFLVDKLRLDPKKFDEITAKCKKSNGNNGSSCTKCGYSIKNPPKHIPKEQLLCTKCLSRKK